jgi:hypothetical protein
MAAASLREKNACPDAGWGLVRGIAAGAVDPWFHDGDGNQINAQFGAFTAARNPRYMQVALTVNS